MSVTKKKLIEWQNAKELLDSAKAHELELRTEICETILDGKTKGTVHQKKFMLDATVTGKENTKIEVDTLKSIFKKLNAEEKACIKYKPELVNNLYKDLPDDSIFHQVVTSTPGTPTLKIKPIED